MPAPLWEKKEHGGLCGFGSHLEYRVRKPGWVLVCCKVCKHTSVELYEHSFLTMPMREEMAA